MCVVLVALQDWQHCLGPFCTFQGLDPGFSLVDLCTWPQGGFASSGISSRNGTRQGAWLGQSLLAPASRESSMWPGLPGADDQMTAEEGKVSKLGPKNFH